MTHGSLFSGIGGFDYAAEQSAIENIFHCEWIYSKRKILKHHFPNSFSHGDITETDFTVYRNRIDILSGGFPCQDASIAKQDGKGQQGLQGERTGLFYHMCRAISEIRPRYVIAENVSNILKTNGGQDFSAILTELSGMGYNAEWRICRASDVGAPHHRARLYLVAYSNNIRLQKGQTFFSYVRETSSQIPWVIGGTSVQTFRGGAWKDQPPVLCLDEGISKGMDYSGPFIRECFHGYGNAIVPEIAIRIFKRIKEIDEMFNPHPSIV